MTDETPAAVGIVVVSHSAEVADATVRLVVRLANLAGGRPATGRRRRPGGREHRHRCDAHRRCARRRRTAGAGVVVLADLGSAVLPPRTAVDELIEPDLAGRGPHLGRADRGGHLRGRRAGIHR